MTGAEWIQVVSLITGSITAIATPIVGYCMWTLRQGVIEAKATIDETKGQVEETKGKIEETKEKVNLNLEKLDGRLSLLLAEMEKRVRAETRVEVETEAKIIAEELVKTNTVAWEKQTKDKAVADALILKTATDKAQLDEMEQALIDSEAQRALQTSKAEAEKLAEKKASAPTTPTMVLEAEPQNVELHVAGTMTEGEKDAREKEPVKKREEEKK